MMGGAKAHYDGIVAFSQTDFTEDLKKITVPVLVMHGDDDQIVPYADSAPLSAKLLKNGTLKTYKGFPHGMPTTEAATINADLLAFIKSRKSFCSAPPAWSGRASCANASSRRASRKYCRSGAARPGCRTPSCMKSCTTISRTSRKSNLGWQDMTPASSALASPRSAWTRSVTGI
jgi:hypothetical protein